VTKSDQVEGCAADPRLWVVEWSPDQRCLHVERLGDVLETNRTIMLGRRASPGYLLIAIFETEDEAEDFADAFEARMRVN
jgi:hypothetical protein